MTKKTHQAGGMLLSILGFSMLRENNLLLPDVSEGLQWLIIYPFCMWSSTANDMDLHWASCPSRDYPSWFVHKALHVSQPLQRAIERRMDRSRSKGRKKRKSSFYRFVRTLNARHRSWQTHSDLTLYFLLTSWFYLVYKNVIGLGVVEISIMSLVMTGIVFGSVAHLVLDMLTPDGIWLMPFVLLQSLIRLIKPNFRLPRILVKFHLVPNRPYFSTTDGRWDELVQKVLKVATIFAIIWFLLVLIYPRIAPLIPYKLEFNLGGK